MVNFFGSLFMLWGLGWKELQGDVGQLGGFGYAKGNLRQLFKIHRQAIWLRFGVYGISLMVPTP